ncbi:hypothetical protein TNIN_487641 [Trichonephila inaurata madagascariensis]|uniref:Uncharacterized protein n=1 Tax=Trichonephila inaurata madagascariensis TaxID=2747483 RepID=A0A8X7BXS4_9ARAC|nr:hypothetical protein TNIN_487641 [Trichonephila inaurata madagascariensis]
MYGFAIRQFLEKCEHHGSSFKGVFSADRIPDLRQWEKASVIVNTQISVGEYGHWLTLYYKDNKLEFFDSFGRHFAEFQYISDYVKQFPDVVSNTIQIQNISSVVCGLYCIFFTLLRDLNYEMNQILKGLSDLGKDRDQHLYNLYTIFNNVFDKLQATEDINLKRKICYDAFIDFDGEG